ncbi:MAG: hypothetical protein H0Z18_03050 [Thermococcus sp.]|uniref:hypothetical protein n=1 Tax=Thermococcus sp. TaxID=35749 RepID=UPI001D36C7C0|nr:hypothetical protein [Thermococcus sp.]MBO8174219.1 hypothetical protein [Thermococcus sp.]
MPLMLCQEGEDYLTGLSIGGPFIGAVLIAALLLLLWLTRKYLVKAILASIVAVTLGGVGYLIGSMFIQGFEVPLALGFFILGLLVSLKMPKAKDRSVVRTSIGSSEDESGFFDNDEWDWGD